MNDKPKCPVFGCTIPRGIPHEHPAGVSAVMRDPAAPLSAYERAELLALRREAALRLHAQQMQRQQHKAIQQAQYMQNPWGLLGLGMRHDPDTATGQAHAADQLADAIHYGVAFNQGGRQVPIKDVYVVPEDAPIHGGRKLTQALLEAGRTRWEGADVGVVLHQAPEPRRTLAQSVGKFMAWMFGIPALLLAAFAIGHYFGWWV